MCTILQYVQHGVWSQHFEIQFHRVWNHNLKCFPFVNIKVNISTYHLSNIKTLLTSTMQSEHYRIIEPLPRASYKPLPRASNKPLPRVSNKLNQVINV